MRISIRYKVLSAFLAVSLTIVTISGVYIYLKLNDTMVNQIKNNVGNLMLEHKGQIDKSIKMLDSFGNYFAYNDFMTSALYLENIDPLKFNFNINRFEREYKNVQNLLFGMETENYMLHFYVNKKLPMASALLDGNMALLDSNSTGLYSTKNIENEKWYIDTLKKDGEMNIFRLEESSPYIYFSKLVKSQNPVHPNDDFLGVNLAGINYALIVNQLKKHQLTENMSFAVLDWENNIVYKSSNSPEMSYIIGKNEKIAPLGFVAKEDKKYVTTMIKYDAGVTLMSFLPHSDVSLHTNDIRMAWLAAIITLVALIITTSILLSYYLTKPIKSLSQVMSSMPPGEVMKIQLKIPANDEVGDLYIAFNRLMSTMSGLIKDLVEKNEQNKKMEMMMYQLQINPHFLYNTLDSIAWKAMMVNSDDLVDMVECLACVFRYSIKNENELVPINEELEIVKKYVSLQKKRYDNLLQISFDLAPECESLRVPKCILQPLIENSIIHAFSGKNNTVEIKVIIRRKDNLFEIRVEDNGSNCDVEKLNAFLSGDTTAMDGGTGIKNVKMRVSLTYGQSSGLFFEKSVSGSTAAIIRISPQKT